MDLDLTKLPAQDKAICAGAISACKQIRDGILPSCSKALEASVIALDSPSPKPNSQE